MVTEMYLMQYLRQLWTRSKAFRAVLIVAALYAVLRLAVHGLFLVELVRTEPEGYDLQLYLDASSHLLSGEEVYLEGTLNYVEFYQYAPSFALAFAPFLYLPMGATMAILSILHLVAYGLLYWLWGRIFHRLGLKRAGEMLAGALPLWLVFSQFWADLGYLNIYVFMALWATLLIDAVLHERLGGAVLWLSIILQTKPQWAFAAIVPLLLGRYRFFLKLVGLALVAYAGTVVVVMLTVGPQYGWQQYVEYVRFLVNMRGNLVWRGPDAPFLGYDHSITQTVVYLLGVTPTTMRLATTIKVALLVPLGVVSLRYMLRPIRAVGRDMPRLALALAFAFYLGAFIWLDVVWEVTYSIVLFTYLLATLDVRGERILAWGVFLPYALLDLWQLVSFIILGYDAFSPDGVFIVTDPAIYIPLVMIVILAFYALFIRQLWAMAPTAQHKETA